MNFLMTDYVYPLSEKVPLSKALNLYLDNPRTAEEIEAVRRYITRAYSAEFEFGSSEHDSEEAKALRDLLESVILEFCETFSPTDSYVEGICKSYEREKLFEFMARIWVVARYDDEGQIKAIKDEHKKFAEEGKVVVTLFEDDHPILKNSKRLTEYSSLLSLLIHTQGEHYPGYSFILDPDPSQFGVNKPNERLHMRFVLFGLSCQTFGVGLDEEELRWKFFPCIKQTLKDTIELLDSAFDADLGETLMYIASLLKTVEHDISDKKFKLVVLVSIIELLLTHSPDYNRFNVEDSISKQFRLKVSTLVYLNDRSRDLNQIKNRLKTIYVLRSNISHGNFRPVQKYIENLSKKEGAEEYFDDLLSDLYTYIRVILFEYLKDPVFVKFLKEN